MKRVLLLSLFIPLLMITTGCDAEIWGDIGAGIGILLIIGFLIWAGLIVYAVIDLLSSDLSMAEKVLWGIIILIIPFLGSLAYLIMKK